MIYMICYDVADPKRLKRVAKVMENHGVRVQYSFFQCDIDKEILEVLQEKIFKEMDLSEDYFFIYPLCKKCSDRAITDGTGSLIKLESFCII